MGTVGGILPDIDADHSIPGRMFFSFFALVVAFLTLFSRAGVYSIVELSILWGVTYVLVRYVIFKLFARLSVHRGVFHSLLAAVFFGFLTTSLTVPCIQAQRLSGLDERALCECGLHDSSGP